RLIAAASGTRLAKSGGMVSAAPRVEERPLVVDDQRDSAQPPGWAMPALLCAAQFMVVLDFSIVNVALPSIQREFGLSQERLQWLVSAYALTFGGFLLLGGRAADLFGRRRMFIVGLVLFACASLLGGIAPNAGLPIAVPRLANVTSICRARSPRRSGSARSYSGSPRRPTGAGRRVGRGRASRSHSSVWLCSPRSSGGRPRRYCGSACFASARWLS